MSSMHLNRSARIALVALAALVLGACGAVTTPPAATVGDVEISQSDLLDEARMVRDSEFLRQQQEGAGGSVVGETDGSFDAGFVANLLQVRVYVALVEDELDRRGVEVSDGEVEEARQRLVQQAGGEQALAQLPSDFVDAQVRQDAVVTALGRELVGGDAEALYEEDPGQFDELCVSHIFVSTDERSPEDAAARADELAGRLDAGEPFEQLAADESDDPQSGAEGGSLGCGGRGRFIVEFEEAAFALDEGEVSDPVQSPVGYHLIRVDERTERSFEEARDDIAASVQAEVGPAIQQFLVEASADVDVEVNPRFGSWVVDEGTPGRVVPPEGPTQPLAPVADPFDGSPVDPADPAAP